jgi:hypothetical protein
MRSPSFSARRILFAHLVETLLCGSDLAIQRDVLADPASYESR